MRRWSPLVVAVLVTLPAATTGFVLDDWVQRAVVRGQFDHTTKLALFNFGAGDAEALAPYIERGPYPWFTLPELKLRFLRPLSSALIVLDTGVFGASAWPQHLHSTLWYVALTAVVLALYRRLVPGVAVLAGVLFALDDAHVMPAAWLANRNAIVAVTFVWAGLLAHLAWRERGWGPGAFVSAGCYVVGLAAGETAVAALAYVLAFEVAGQPERSLLARARGLVPLASVVGAYFVAYKLLHAGARGSATYIDPVGEPLAFLPVAPLRFFANVGTQAFGFPDVWIALPEAKGLVTVAGVVAVPLALLAWRRWAPADESQRRRLGWLLLGSAGAMVPGLATFPAVRLLTAASLGLCAVVATLLVSAWRDRGVRRVLGVCWLGAAFVVQPLSQWLVLPLAFDAIGERARQALRHLSLSGGERVVVLSSTDFVPAVYAVPLLAELQRPLPRTWQVWSMAPLAVEVRRTGERQLELEVVGGRMIDSMFEENFRGDGFPLRVGDRVQLEKATITVLAVEGGKPTMLRGDLELAAAEYTFVWWDGETLSRVTLPEPGQARRFPSAQTMFDRLLRGRREQP
ncbi:MAG: hypothetical protein JNJ54_32515 [Myxococcaceae bacterium]|nr:hypothetical protein [Myxococcaceae bacterium]